MEETYTFSRALHLMRYGGKKMKPINEPIDYYQIIGNVIYNQEGITLAFIDCRTIMGSWVEVK